ncbi:MAG: hypothetical protein R3F59_16510 [Myxococcota bacterium]
MKRAWALLALGLVAMAGDALHATPVFAVATAWGASPAPKVFTTRDGLEGFSARFTLEGPGGSVDLDPETYRRLRGPYNRRNVYGAALAGGPYLVDHPYLGALHHQVATYAFCRETSVLDELGVPLEGPVTLVVTPRTGTHTDLPLRIGSPCGR